MSFEFKCAPARINWAGAFIVLSAILLNACSTNNEKIQQAQKSRGLISLAAVDTPEYLKQFTEIFIPDTTSSIIVKPLPPVTLRLTGNSGYISKKKGFKFLSSQLLTDTSDYLWKMLKDEDIIGRYYRIGSTNNYLVCLLNIKPNHYLFKIAVNGKRKKIISQEKYFHGMYTCCWNNDYEGFRKMNDFFYFKTCMTGSAYCGRMFYLFKDLHPQDSLNIIYESNYSRNSLEFQSLSSTINLKDTTLEIKYISRTGIIKEYTNKDYFDNITKSTKKFTVSYRCKNDKWFATDSTNIRDLNF